MKKLCLNDNCIGCGACVAIDPEHFDFGDDGLSSVVKNDNLDTNEVANAISSCPVSAISIKECECNCGDTCECDDTCECGCK